MRATKVSLLEPGHLRYSMNREGGGQGNRGSVNYFSIQKMNRTMGKSVCEERGSCRPLLKQRVAICRSRHDLNTFVCRCPSDESLGYCW